MRQNLLAPQRVKETPLLPCGGSRCGGMPTRNATCAPTPSTNCRRVEELRCGENRHELAGRAVQHRHARYQRRKANLRPLGAPARRGKAWRGRWSTPSPLPPFLVTPCNTCPRVVCISTVPNCACRNIRRQRCGCVSTVGRRRVRCRVYRGARRRRRRRSSRKQPTEWFSSCIHQLINCLLARARGSGRGGGGGDAPERASLCLLSSSAAATRCANSRSAYSSK